MARPEVTGRKLGASAGPVKQEKREEPQEPPKLLAMTIPQFCEAHGLSNGSFYKLKRDGKAPRQMRVGMRVMISYEAAADWRAACESDVEAHESAERSWTLARGKLRNVEPSKASKAVPKPRTKPKRAEAALSR